MSETNEQAAVQTPPPYNHQCCGDLGNKIAVVLSVIAFVLATAAFALSVSNGRDNHSGFYYHEPSCYMPACQYGGPPRVYPQGLPPAGNQGQTQVQPGGPMAGQAAQPKGH